MAATTTALAAIVDVTATAKIERKRLRNKKYKAKKLATRTGRTTTTDNEANNRADDRTNVAAAEAVAGPEEAEAVTVSAAVTQPID